MKIQTAEPSPSKGGGAEVRRCGGAEVVHKLLTLMEAEHEELETYDMDCHRHGAWHRRGPSLSSDALTTRHRVGFRLLRACNRPVSAPDQDDRRATGADDADCRCVKDGRCKGGGARGFSHA